MFSAAPSKPARTSRWSMERWEKASCRNSGRRRRPIQLKNSKATFGSKGRLSTWETWRGVRDDANWFREGSFCHFPPPPLPSPGRERMANTTAAGSDSREREAAREERADDEAVTAGRRFL